MTSERRRMNNRWHTNVVTTVSKYSSHINVLSVKCHSKHSYCVSVGGNVQRRPARCLSVPQFCCSRKFSETKACSCRAPCGRAAAGAVCLVCRVGPDSVQVWWGFVSSLTFPLVCHSRVRKESNAVCAVRWGLRVTDCDWPWLWLTVTDRDCDWLWLRL